MEIRKCFLRKALKTGKVWTDGENYNHIGRVGMSNVGVIGTKSNMMYLEHSIGK